MRQLQDSWRGGLLLPDHMYQIGLDVQNCASFRQFWVFKGAYVSGIVIPTLAKRVVTNLVANCRHEFGEKRENDSHYWSEFRNW